MSGLLAGWDWFDKRLQSRLEARGIPTLNKTQSMMMMYISAGVQRPVEFAKRMRLSKQAIRHISEQLAEIGYIEITEHPDDKRGRHISFVNDTLYARDVAEEIIADLEQELCSRIGADNVEALKRILQLDWEASVSGTDIDDDID